MDGACDLKQAYVALSRVRSLAGLSLLDDPFRGANAERVIRAHPKVQRSSTSLYVYITPRCPGPAKAMPFCSANAPNRLQSRIPLH